MHAYIYIYIYIIRRSARPGIYSLIFYASQRLTRICFSKCNIHKGAKSKRTSPKLVGLQVSVDPLGSLHEIHVLQAMQSPCPRQGISDETTRQPDFLSCSLLTVNQCLDVPWHSQFTICVWLKIENSRIFFAEQPFLMRSDTDMNLTVLGKPWSI